jgi:fructoselysine-6-P-deglycase FrlB-like protein
MYAEEETSPATLGEIYNQASACAETIERAPLRLRKVQALLPLDQYTDIIITGCGSSHHLGLCAAFAWGQMLGRSVSAVAASELMHFADHYLTPSARPLVLAISRSGGTTEVRLAVERLRKDYGARAVALTGEPGGAVARVCDAELAFTECYERSVVMTQAFTCMLTGLYLLADGATGWTRLSEIERIPQVVARALEPSEQVLRPIAEDDRINKFFYLGSGPMKGLADECALKMTEMALAQAVSHRALEFRHGPKAALDRDSQVIVFPVAAERPHLATLAAEIEATDAQTLLISDCGLRVADFRAAEMNILKSAGLQTDPLNPQSEIFLPAAYAHVGQLLAYWRAAARDMDPDAPPHLARTVLLCG